MSTYLIRRFLLAIPVLFGITLICFVIIHLAPGGPLERKMAELRFGSMSEGIYSSPKRHHVNKEIVEALKKQYGFDKPLLIRYLLWLKKVALFDFGESFIYEEPVVDIILSKLPVSIQFGGFSFLLIYLVSIPLGLFKAVKDGSPWDGTSSFILILTYATPPLVLGILLKTYLAGGAFVDWFPAGDLYSDDYFSKNFLGRLTDRLHHFVLPLICYSLGSFTVITFLMKNSVLEHIRADYIRTAYAKGLSPKIVIGKHALKNALIPIMTGLGNFLQFFLAGSLIIEKMFNLDGIGLLGYESAIERDFHVLLALLFIQAILNLLGRLISDLSLVMVDPRITFSK